MTMSMKVLSAGEGVSYLLHSVASGDGVHDAAAALTRYYQEKGTPPGRWMGSDLGAFGDGSLRPEMTVSDGHLRLLLGMACDPLTGEPLGKRFPRYRTPATAIDRESQRMPTALTGNDRADAVNDIAEHAAGQPSRNAVAGFDHTFSVPKSVSALWAVADGGTQTLIARAHTAAIYSVLAMLEREVAATRAGTDSGTGSVRVVDVHGVVATAYDHYDSRSSDPQLHTHVVIANRVRGIDDPTKWRTLDGRPIHAAVVALSEHYNALLADNLSRLLGLDWERRARGGSRNDTFELAAVPDTLIAEFSSRSHDIERRKEELIAEWSARHDGRTPSKRTVLKLRQIATLDTRPDKVLYSLAELTVQWRRRAATALGQDAIQWANGVVRSGCKQALLRADDLPYDYLQALAVQVVAAVGERRSTWSRWNLHAEATRQLQEHRFAHALDRERVVDTVVDAAERVSVQITPGEIAFTPTAFRRSDGSSEFRLKHGALFTSQAILDAEDRLLALAADTTAPTIPLEVAEQWSRRPQQGLVLSTDQQLAVTQITVSGRVVDVLVGPAGAGKTSTLRALRTAWEQEHGTGSVIGLAPTAAAAQVLADELGITTENTPKWAADHEMGRWDFQQDQLLIIDEASLSGTFLLDRLTQHAAAVGAKVLLVGDRHQHGAVESSGAFGLIADSIEDRPELTEVWRFRNEWERQASLQLRLAEPEAIDEYARQGRIHGGDLTAMLDAAYEGWLADQRLGHTTLMIAETNDTVTALNLRARIDRIDAGLVDAEHGVRLRDGSEASRGDLIVTRQNDRRFRIGKSWVKNGDLWTVTGTHDDGSVDVRPLGRRTGSYRLQATYVADHVELA